jgi:Repeat of unknown function (DUF5650)
MLMNRLRATALLIFCVLQLETSAVSNTIDIVGPSGSWYFGRTVLALPNGNFVIIDPAYSSDHGSFLGAVYLYNPRGELISTLTGASPYIALGNGGITVLSNGNFVVCSPPDPPSRNTYGYTTWVNGTTGLTGVVTQDNSLIDYNPRSDACSASVVALTNGNYIVLSAEWKNSNGAVVGAVTWCDGSVGCHGPISEANSLVGVADGDAVGWTALALQNGKYAVASPWWGLPDMPSLGAVTFCGDASGCVGSVTAGNSLIGSQATDHVGDNDPSDSLVALPNGDFVVMSPIWHDALGADVGAVTRIDGTTGFVGRVSADNSLTGTVANDFVAITTTPLNGGAFVITVPYWDNGALQDAGAAVLCSDANGCPRKITSVNSLVGAYENDKVGANGTAVLSSGDYVVGSSEWNAERGAVTLCRLPDGCVGTIAALNSLVGIAPGDQVGGRFAVAALVDGNYVVGSGSWNSVGASTWCDGSLGCVGSISSDNSFIGSGNGTQVGTGVAPLSNGSYVIFSALYDNALFTGSATVARGALSGLYTGLNSFTGVQSDTGIGGSHIFPVANGNFVLHAEDWTVGSNWSTGAVSLVRGYGARPGTFTTENSVFGTTQFGGTEMTFTYDVVADTLIVGRPRDNVVSLLKVDQLFFSGFD